MIVDAATYVTDRIAASAAESAADRVGPKVIWGVAIVMFGVAGIQFDGRVRFGKAVDLGKFQRGRGRRRENHGRRHDDPSCLSR